MLIRGEVKLFFLEGGTAELVETKYFTGLSQLPAVVLWQGIYPKHHPKLGKCGPSSRVTDKSVPSVMRSLPESTPGLGLWGEKGWELYFHKDSEAG